MLVEPVSEFDANNFLKLVDPSSIPSFNLLSREPFDISVQKPLDSLTQKPLDSVQKPLDSSVQKISTNHFHPSITSALIVDSSTDNSASFLAKSANPSLTIDLGTASLHSILPHETEDNSILFSSLRERMKVAQKHLIWLQSWIRCLVKSQNTQRVPIIDAQLKEAIDLNARIRVLMQQCHDLRVNVDPVLSECDDEMFEVV